MAHWKRISVCLLGTSLLLSACSKGDSGSPAPSNSPGGTGQAQATQKPKLTLNWFIAANQNASLPAGDKDFVKKTIEEKFNVDLKIQHLALGTDYTNKLNLLLSGGTPPDLMVTDGRASNNYIVDQVVADLTKYVTPQTMPNYFKYWTNEAEVKQYQVQGVYKRAPLGFARQLYTSYYIRKDWLDKLNLKIPETYDEMIEVMKQFTFNDPDGNGKNDTFGMSAAGGGSAIPGDFPEFYKHQAYVGSLVDGDQYIDTRTDLRMEKVLNDLKKTLDMKIIDPDWFLNKAGQQIDKAAQGKIGIVISGARDAALDNYPNSLQKKTKDVTGVKTADWQPFHPWAKEGVNMLPAPGNPFMFSVKASEDKIKRSVEILDWLASEEGFLLTHYGVEGRDYKKNGNKIEVVPDAYKANITDNGSFLDIYGFFTPIEPEVFKFEIMDPRETDRDRAILAKLKSYKYYDALGTSLTVGPGIDLAAMRAQMNKLQTKILFEEKDASNWPKYRQELMTKYAAKEIFEGYAQQVGTARGKTLKFKSEN
ncbi:hypothetical protein J31TS4_20270 [Paenibacillus sp. J31TS4]|uniref:extracellular solute-binding protein n=1 Tax=Paenibacillus sp. J31TS4 TaxID=2807195 RepID=UPI001B10555F|nr:extracellular solute-binding protein [Paenibacillus sp. J31TS4]GIP38747.1 hypothetical protein J31TS4_20270 [Paenibacillus sp. J31TS4]